MARLNTVKFNLACGDVLEVLRGQPENSFDACLCDPPYGISFMGKQWDHGVPSSDIWRDILRVLKPGAMLMAFGGTRTHHRLMCAIEDAGFEIRDCCMWLYGSGFPKSLDISKKIDKAAGVRREVVGTAPATDAAKTWDGYGTALKPAWEPIIVAMKPLDGTYADNALKHGVAGLNIDAGRIGRPDGKVAQIGSPGWGGPNKKLSAVPDQNGETVARTEPSQLGRWPANLILDEEAAAELDAQSGTLKSGANPTRRHGPKTRNAYGDYPGGECIAHRGQDSGGASRFFYCAKASTSERGAGNNHPTVKPLKLTQHLATLLLPPAREDGERRILVPFAGSGSELIGARAAGWDFGLGIELDPAYAGIAKKRLVA